MVLEAVEPGNHVLVHRKPGRQLRHAVKDENGKGHGLAFGFQRFATRREAYNANKKGGGGRPSLKWLAVSPAAVRSSRPSGVSLAWGARGHNSDTLPVKSRPGIWWEAPPFPA